MIHAKLRLLQLIMGRSVETRRKNRRAILSCDVAEDRIVPTAMNFQTMLMGLGGKNGFRPPALIGNFTPKIAGFDIMRSLGDLGILPGGKIGGEMHGMPKPGTPMDPANQVLFDNLKAAVDKLQTDGQAMVAKSGVTIADMMALGSDASTIMSTGAKIDMAALDATMNKMARAVVGGTSTDDARTAFNALFTGTSVKQETIDKTFADLTGAISRSNLTIADLDLIAADRAAVDAARKAIADAGLLTGKDAGAPPAATAPTTPAPTTPATGQPRKPAVKVVPVRINTGQIRKIVGKPVRGRIR